MDANERQFCCTLLREANAQLMNAAVEGEFAFVRMAARIISRVQGYLLTDAIPFHELAALTEIQRLGSISLADGLDVIDRMARTRMSAEREDLREDPRLVAEPDGGAAALDAPLPVGEVGEVSGVNPGVRSPPAGSHNEDRPWVSP